ncbi:hypothetical protein NPIL_20751 [Nephila pilipes]|uniref:RING-type domain-containing protein n=1 Tax=Nephila pilipes TaxID=299642 RepID=A0A8X6TBI0_NEPPI|nr:hypothetical protein NPIL_20751 [Nephila pilipes]
MMEKCVVCFEVLDSKTFELNCQHSFHMNCIKTWLRTGHSNCPYCRTEIDKEKKKLLGFDGEEWHSFWIDWSDEEESEEESEDSGSGEPELFCSL